MSGIMLAHRAAFHGGIVLPAIGSAFYGGYYAGIIDTTKSNIIAADYYQTGQRFAVIVAGLSLEASKAYKTTNDAPPASSSTRWNGLDATAAMNAPNYPAAYYCAGLTYPSDGGSAWYLPAMDELEIIYRNLKCSTENNYTVSQSGTFPAATIVPGYNPSSDPAGAAHTSSVPAQTTVAAFQSGGAQALGVSGSNRVYWCATANNTSTARYQIVSGTAAGSQNSTSENMSNYVRPVRRLVLA